MSWRVSKALLTLRSEVEKAHPGRSKVSDGTVGDTSHSARVSDHNPDENGIVHAWDVTVWDGPDGDNLDDVAQPLAEFLRAGRDPRVKYVIHRGRMFRSYDKPGIPAWTWSPYTGPNGHFHHVHVSVYGDDGAPWGYPGTTTPTTPPEDIDMTKAELEQVLAAALAPIKAELAEVKRQVATSADPKAKGGATLRWITTKAAKQEKIA